MDDSLGADFPNLNLDNHFKTSPADDDYNCIAWAAGKGSSESEWWWPDEDGDSVWPAGVPRENTIECFVAAFRTLGYDLCEDDSAEQGLEKVALYALDNGEPTHMARQLPDGNWTSKLGNDIDITHTDLEC